MNERHAECPFCDGVAWQRESSGIDNDLRVFLTRPEPLLVDSGPIITRRHCATVFEMSLAEWQASLRGAPASQDLPRRNAPAARIQRGVEQRRRKRAGDLPVHLHVIPRFADELLAGKGIRYWLKQETNRRSAHGMPEGVWQNLRADDK